MGHIAHLRNDIHDKISFTSMISYSYYIGHFSSQEDQDQKFKKINNEY